MQAHLDGSLREKFAILICFASAPSNMSCVMCMLHVMFLVPELLPTCCQPVGITLLSHAIPGFSAVADMNFDITPPLCVLVQLATVGSIPLAWVSLFALRTYNIPAVHTAPKSLLQKLIVKSDLGNCSDSRLILTTAMYMLLKPVAAFCFLCNNSQQQCILVAAAEPELSSWSVGELLPESNLSAACTTMGCRHKMGPATCGPERIQLR